MSDDSDSGELTVVTEVLRLLGQLEKDGRERVIRTVATYYGSDVVELTARGTSGGAVGRGR